MPNGVPGVRDTEKVAPLHFYNFAFIIVPASSSFSLKSDTCSYDFSSNHFFQVPAFQIAYWVYIWPLRNFPTPPNKKTGEIAAFLRLITEEYSPLSFVSY